MTENQANETPLESWKEIAAYLQRDVRTLMRWEKKEGLPVRRHLHKSRSSVYAYPSELDAWRANREPDAGSESPGWLRPVPVFASTIALALALMMAGSGPPVSAVAQAADGIVTRQVWADEDTSVTGGISPDGRYLTYTDWATGELAVRDLTTGENRNITNKGSWEDSGEFAESSIFSPDGEQIVYQWFSTDSSYDLHIVRSDGSGDRLLLRGSVRDGKADYFQPLAWYSDGRHILAALYTDWPTGDLALLSVADGSVQVIKSGSWSAGPGNSTAQASLSPDGRYIVYDQAASEGADQSDIFLVAADGSADSVIVQDPADDRDPVWTPDGKRVLFASDRTGAMGFWSIEIADGSPQGVPKLVKADVGQWSGTIGFTQNGSLYYSLDTGMEDVYVAELDPASGEVVIEPKRASTGFVGSNMGPAWSPDGQYLAYDSQRERDRFAPGALVTVILNIQTGEDREIRTGFVKSGPTYWFPDGQSLLYPVYRDRDVASQAVDYYRLDVQTGETTLIRQSSTGIDSNYPSLSPDGRTIYFEHREAGRSSLMACEIDSQREQEVHAAGANARIPYAAVSPDNSELAFVEGGTVAKIISVSGGEPRELLRVEPPQYLSFSAGGITWSPDGEYLITAACDGDSPAAADCELLRIRSEDGESQRLGLGMTGIKPVSVHPDGRRIAFGSGSTKRSRSEIWMMENLAASTEE